jgi:hypothetical protein
VCVCVCVNSQKSESLQGYCRTDMSSGVVAFDLGFLSGMTQRIDRLILGAGELLRLMRHQRPAFMPLYLSTFGVTLHHDVCVSRLFILTGPPDVGKSKVCCRHRSSSPTLNHAARRCCGVSLGCRDTTSFACVDVCVCVSASH